MENNKLVSMTEFVLNEYSKLKNNQTDDSTLEFTDNVVNYANFLNKPLTLGMFIPVDENGNVLSEPVKPHTYASENTDEYIKHYNSQVNAYKFTKERVLFEGFEWDNILEQGRNKQNGIYFDKGNHTIEDLIQYKPILTQTALAMIYG